VRASARGAAPAEPPGGAAGRRSERTERLARFGERELPTPVWRGAPAADGDLEGPAIVELPTTTVAVPPGWRWRASAHAIELRSA
jgi:N-methylhydantoinase A/oxoprolinase/acetone carboxylase beta subunit